MATTAHATGTQTATVTTEHAVSTVTVAGVFSFHIDVNAMVAGDVTEFRVYQIVLTAGTKRVVFFHTLYGAQPTDDKILVSLPIGNELTDASSLEFSLKQTFGTGRAYPFKILKYA